MYTVKLYPRIHKLAVRIVKKQKTRIIKIDHTYILRMVDEYSRLRL